MKVYKLLIYFAYTLYQSVRLIYAENIMKYNIGLLIRWFRMIKYS